MFPSTVSTLSLSARVCPFQTAFAISAFLSFQSDSYSRALPHHSGSSKAAAYAAGLTRVYHGFTGNGKSSFVFLQNTIESIRFIGSDANVKPPPPLLVASSQDQ